MKQTAAGTRVCITLQIKTSRSNADSVCWLTWLTAFSVQCNLCNRDHALTGFFALYQVMTHLKQPLLQEFVIFHNDELMEPLSADACAAAF